MYIIHISRNDKVIKISMFLGTISRLIDKLRPAARYYRFFLRLMLHLATESI
jgi:hypothetical protein